MQDNYKKRIENILKRSANEELKLVKKEVTKKTKRKNGKPEKITEAECLVWMRENKWDVAIYESKAIFNKSAGCYMKNNGLKVGTCDCIGSTNEGIGVFIEFKAKGKINTFGKVTNAAQQDFIKSKIECGAFACVVDSKDLLEKTFSEWKNHRLESLESGKNYLKSVLPLVDEGIDFEIS